MTEAYGDLRHPVWLALVKARQLTGTWLHPQTLGTIDQAAFACGDAELYVGCQDRSDPGAPRRYAAALDPDRHDLGQALALLRPIREDDLEGRAGILDSLGYIAHHTERHAQALRFYRQALQLYHAIGNNYEAANTHARLATTHQALGEHDHVRHAWQQALDLYRNQHRTAEAENAQHHLDSLARTAPRMSAKSQPG